jgi:hypothetical protein
MLRLYMMRVGIRVSLVARQRGRIAFLLLMFALFVLQTSATVGDFPNQEKCCSIGEQPNGILSACLAKGSGRYQHQAGIALAAVILLRSLNFSERSPFLHRLDVQRFSTRLVYSQFTSTFL